MQMKCEIFSSQNFGQVTDEYFPRYQIISSLIFGPGTHGQTQSDAYEPTVHKHRWAQKSPLSISIGGLKNKNYNM